LILRLKNKTLRFATRRPSPILPAIGMAQLTIQQAFDLAVEHHEAGRLRDAEQLFQQVLAQDPEYVDAIYSLGVIAYQTGRIDEAIDLIRRVITLEPDFAEAHNDLGMALKAKGKLDDAIAAFRQAITLMPDLAEARFNLGACLKEKGSLDEAIACYRQVIALRPTSAEAHYKLGEALREKGQLDEAIEVCRQSVNLDPDSSEAYGNLGISLWRNGQLDEAIVAYRQAVALKPNSAAAHFNLANALKAAGLLDEAIASFRQSIDLGINLAEAHDSLANTLTDVGQLDEAIDAYRQAIALRPSYVSAHSNLIFALHSHPAFDAHAIAHELRIWNRQHAEPQRQFIEPHSNDCDPNRRLRVGYVSADFWDHASARFIVPLLMNHDPRQVEVFCYSEVRKPDAVTSDCQQRVPNWRSTLGVSDEQVARQIREDGIDILVDLKLHTGGNRLLVFAHKPAPMQVTWLGCPGSTGMTAIDYRLSDSHFDPPGMDESVYTEKTIRLPDTYWCYDPLEPRDIPVNSLPARDLGVVTFGCLNTFRKINEPLLALWAQAMQQVHGSQLLLLASPGSPRARTTEYMSRHGIDSHRIEFIPRLTRRDYLLLYHRLDISLDSFPYVGHTTSLDSFWMGVPVVTMPGQTAVSRAGSSHAASLGLSELVANTPENYVKIAVELANDLPKLQSLRAILRQRLEQSPLMDGPRFARNVEAAYRQMWQSWCED
jgi:predicted O-linked N-acetylglucosamine transferase (SPINDLY family)